MLSIMVFFSEKLPTTPHESIHPLTWHCIDDLKRMKLSSNFTRKLTGYPLCICIPFVVAEIHKCCDINSDIRLDVDTDPRRTHSSTLYFLEVHKHIQEYIANRLFYKTRLNSIAFAK